MQNRRILNLITRGVLLPLCLLVFSGCSSNELGNAVEDKIQEKFQESQDNTINVWENQKIERNKLTAEEVITSGITDEMKNKIDKWIEKNNLNKYGDQKSLMYAGGTPLFNETTGEVMDRYEYILRNHPELVSELGIK
ncbi:MAG: hypothetical protein V1860_01150 [bacterium]